MRRRLTSLLSLVAVLVAGTAAAEAIAVLRTNRTVVTVGDAIDVELELADGDTEVVSLPVKPKARVEEAGKQSSVEIINMKVSRSVSMHYRVWPQQVGVTTIGPARLMGDDGPGLAAAVTVTVVASGQARYLDVTAAASPATVYEGQPFRYVVAVRYGAALAPRTWTPPSADGDVEEIPTPDGEGEAQGVVQEGRQPLGIHRLTRWFVPMRPGEVQLRGGGYRLAVVAPQRSRARGGFADPFLRGFDPRGLGPLGAFGTTPASIEGANPPVTVHVLPLPQPPPRTQFLGMVGNVSARFRIDRRSNARIDGVLSIMGPAWAPALRIDPWVDGGWRVYPDAPRMRSTVVDGKPRLRIDVPLTLAPAAGAPPGPTPAWFDPNLGAYRLVALPFDAAPGTQGTALAPVAVTPAVAAAPADAAASVTAASAAMPLRAAPAWARTFDAEFADRLGAVGVALCAAATIAAAWRRRRQRTAAPPRDAAAWRRAVAAACKRRDHDWRATYDELLRLSEPLPPSVAALREQLGAALYAPGGDPRAAARAWLQSTVAASA